MLFFIDYRKVIETNFAYTHENCMMFCLQKHVAAKCKCSDAMVSYRLPSPTTINVCRTRAEMKCLLEFYAAENKEQTEECANQCPLQCNQIKYNNYLTFSYYPTSFYASLLQRDLNLTSDYKNQLDFQNLPENILKVNIYYDSLSYVELKGKFFILN